MSLYDQLQKAKSEEDVKDAYIKALGLKSATALGIKGGYTKGLIDIQTNEVWFEAKHTGRESSYAVFSGLESFIKIDSHSGNLCICD